MKPSADIAVVGLAVMGENLILNMAGRGFTVACYNRTTAKVDAFLRGRAKGKASSAATASPSWSPPSTVRAKS